MNTPAPPDWIDLDQRAKHGVAPPTAAQTPAVPDLTGANVLLATPAPENVPAMPPLPMPQPAALRPDQGQGPAVIQREPVPVETIRIEPPKIPLLEPIPAAAPAHTTPARSASKAPTVSNRPQAAAPPQSRGLGMLSAAVVIVAALGLGGYWLKVHGLPSRAPQPATKMAVHEPRREPQPAPPTAEPVRPAAPVRSAQPAPPNKTRPAAKPAAGQSSAARNRVAVPAPAPAPEPIPAASVSVPTVTAHPEAAPSAGSSPSAAPQGPFYEPTQVNEAPRVVTRVEPAVPEDLRSRARNEIVVIRMLVSQSGRPSRVSLLRRSKTGPRLDDAVIAAVNQWTFSPAKKRGEAVSCWFNMGVPVMAD
jgi:protein TonB